MKSKKQKLPYFNKCLIYEPTEQWYQIKIKIAQPRYGWGFEKNVSSVCKLNTRDRKVIQIGARCRRWGKCTPYRSYLLALSRRKERECPCQANHHDCTAWSYYERVNSPDNPRNEVITTAGRSIGRFLGTLYVKPPTRQRKHKQWRQLWLSFMGLRHYRCSQQRHHGGS